MSIIRIPFDFYIMRSHVIDENNVFYMKQTIKKCFEMSEFNSMTLNLNPSLKHFGLSFNRLKILICVVHTIWINGSLNTC